MDGDLAAGYGKDLQGVRLEGRGLLGAELPGFDVKERVAHEGFFLRGTIGDVAGGDEGGLEVVKIDAGEGLRDVEFAGFAIEAFAVPIVHAVGGVGVLLDLEDDEAAADGVDAAAGEKHGIASANGDAMETISDGAGVDLLLKLLAGDAALEADV